jgi:hypothetical protein
MTDNHVRNVMPEVCANCQHLESPYPDLYIRRYYCRVAYGNGNVRLEVGNMIHAYQKTCDRFSAKIKESIR